MNTLHAYRESREEPAYDSVRGPFLEGDPIYIDAGFHSENHILNRTGNRGGFLVKVKQVPQREPQAVDNSALRLRPVAHRQSIQATVDG
jgi:hypothetical protein